MTAPQGRSTPPRSDEQADALQHPDRYQILVTCGEQACSVGELANVLPNPPSTIRYHVRRLTDVGLLVAETPSRSAGRMITPYRTTPLGQVLLAGS